MTSSCVICGQELEWEAFYKRKNGKPESYCKECRSDRVKMKRGQFPTKLVLVNRVQRLYNVIKTAESLHCRVFVTDGNVVWRWRKRELGLEDLDVWMVKFKDRFEEIT